MNDNIEKQQAFQDLVQLVDPRKQVPIIDPLILFDEETGKEIINPLTFYGPAAKEQQVEKAPQHDSLKHESESLEAKLQAANEIVPQEHVQNEVPYKSGFAPKQEMILTDMGIPTNLTSATGSLTERVLQCGLMKKSPDPMQSLPSASIDVIPAPSNKKEGPTPMSLLNKFKAYRAICVKDHEVYLYMGNCYSRMSQNDMEEEIWCICEKEVQQVGNKSIISGAYQLMIIDRSLRVENLHSSQDLVPFRNGLLRLSDGTFLLPSPMYFVTFRLNCEFPLDPSTAACPIFEKYLQDVSGGDELLIARIWEFLGYILTPDINAKAIFLLQGVRNSGKSVLTNLIEAFYPKAVRTALDAHDMGEKFEIGECEDKAVCICSDMPAEALNNKVVSNMKKLSGRDTISSAVKYRSRKEFSFTGKVIMVTNHPLLLKHDDQAFWERIIAIPFRYQIPREQQIHNLEAKLMAEMPAIASRAILAYFNLRNNHYRFSGDFVANETDMYSCSNSFSADLSTMIFQYLQRFYVRWPDQMVILEDACNDFNSLNSTAISTQVFSQIFRKHAADLFGAEKTRTREGGYQNARSAVKGIKRKFI